MGAGASNAVSVLSTLSAPKRARWPWGTQGHLAGGASLSRAQDPYLHAGRVLVPMAPAVVLAGRAGRAALAASGSGTGAGTLTAGRSRSRSRRRGTGGRRGHGLLLGQVVGHRRRHLVAVER